MNISLQPTYQKRTSQRLFSMLLALFLAAVLVLPAGAGNTYSAQRNFTSSVVTLDDFNRSNGGIGSNWSGNKRAYRISGNELTVSRTGSNSDIYWKDAFGPDQQVFVKFTNVVEQSREQNLLLKTQSRGNWGAGVLEVLYDAVDQVVRVYTYEWPQGWVQHGADIPSPIFDGDTFGARAFANGMVEVYVNGAIVGTRDVSSWSHYDQGGYIGLWFIDAHDAVLDDFGGGDVPLIVDADSDGVADDSDNCVNVPNPGQEDTYGSSAGDACEDLDGDGTPDTAEANFCVSIDGVLLVSVGTAVCDSTPTTGAEPNVAVANGDRATAYAGTNGSFDLLGRNIRVTAIGDYAYAVGGGWDLYNIDGANLIVIANGPGTYAVAAPSSNTSSIAISTDLYNRASSQANYCTDCTSLANGNGANTAAGNGTNNHSEANGEGAYAWARLGNNNTATANGINASATAHWGSNNSATSTGVYTCAGGVNGSNLQNDEVAVNEDLCN